MSLRHIIAIGFVTIILLPAAGHTEEGPAPAPGTASIRGDIVTGFVGTTTVSRIVSVDGNLVLGPVEPCTPVALAPGLHSLVVAYENTDLPIRLDAKPDVTYAVKFTKDGTPFAYVENTKTGESVARISTETDADDLVAPYMPPSGDATQLATLKPVQNMRHGLLGGDYRNGTIAVSAIDGQFVAGQMRSLEKGLGPDEEIRLSPGPHALMIGAAYVLNAGQGTAYIGVNTPIVMNVEAAKTYLLKSSPYLFPTMYHPTFEFWVEDASDGKIVYPKKTYLMNFDSGGHAFLAGVPKEERVDFPGQHGQLKRTPPKPIPWCQHD